jgi:hypothetical protein
MNVADRDYRTFTAWPVEKIPECGSRAKLMPITISAEQVYGAILAGAGAVSAVFHFALYIGKLMNRMELVERRVDVHDEYLIGRRSGDHTKVIP